MPFVRSAVFENLAAMIEHDAFDLGLNVKFPCTWLGRHRPIVLERFSLIAVEGDELVYSG